VEEVEAIVLEEIVTVTEEVVVVAAAVVEEANGRVAMLLPDDNRPRGTHPLPHPVEVENGSAVWHPLSNRMIEEIANVEDVEVATSHLSSTVLLHLW
jgi:hypothetical protein